MTRGTRVLLVLMFVILAMLLPVGNAQPMPGSQMAQVDPPVFSVTLDREEVYERRGALLYDQNTMFLLDERRDLYQVSTYTQ